MRKALPVIVAILLITLTGCGTYHDTKKITERLKPAELYESYRVRPAKLKARSKCPLPRTINIINAETREDEYVIWTLHSGLTKSTVNPKELTSAILEYLKYGFEKSQIEVDSNSPKIVHVSFEDAKTLPGVFSKGSEFKLKVDIPETKYSEIYEAKEWQAQFLDYDAHHDATAYAIHDVTRQIIDDPVIQDYILCR
jgi:hypothetical protein